jgi:hypothetical protein
VPNLYFYINWIKDIGLNFLVTFYLHHKKLFKIVTLGLWDDDSFYHKYVKQHHFNDHLSKLTHNNTHHDQSESDEHHHHHGFEKKKPKRIENDPIFTLNDMKSMCVHTKLEIEKIE